MSLTRADKIAEITKREALAAAAQLAADRHAEHCDGVHVVGGAS